VLNGVFFTIVCVTGTLAWIAWAIPIDAGMAIVLWIGIVITAQAFQATPREHAPAVVIGMLPGIGAWGAIMAKNGLRAAGLGAPGHPFSAALIGEFLKGDTWIHGAFSLEQGFLFTSMLLSAAVVSVIERQWAKAAAWYERAAHNGVAEACAQLAAMCTSCHRLDGGDGGIPTILGMSPEMLTRAMLAYRSSERPSHIMRAVALSLSDEEIATVARYLAALNK